MVTALKLAKDLNNTSLEELVSSLRSHEIVLDQDEPQKRGKSIALKSDRRSAKSQALQAEEIEDSEGDSDDEEDELSLLSRRVNRLWKRNQGNIFRSSRRTRGHFESTSGQRKSSGNEVICFECNEPGHYMNDYPKLLKEKPKKKALKGKKKG